jgi:hypothetical protein
LTFSNRQNLKLGIDFNWDRLCVSANPTDNIFKPASSLRMTSLSQSMMISHTSEIALFELENHEQVQLKKSQAHGTNLSKQKAAEEGRSSSEVQEATSTVEEPERPPEGAIVVEAIQSWNRPRRNVYRVFAAFFAFIVLGMNDASYGVSWNSLLKIEPCS